MTTAPTGALVIAHRGDWLERSPAEPQNSIGAVLGALEAGADGAEIDARLAADGTVVLHHDAEIGRPDIEAGCAAPEGTPVCALGAAALGHLATLAGLLGTLGPATTGALAAGRPGPFVLNIELKDLPGEPGWPRRQELAFRVAELIGAAHLESWRPGGPVAAPDRTAPSAWQVIVSSFDPDGLDRFRRCSPGTTTALLLDQGDDWPDHLAGPDGLSAVNPSETMASPELFAQAKARGLAVVPWTVDSPRRAVELTALGAAGLITNRPRALLKALNRS
jgi:glycerophosphoryl diester phosphodiesterase